MLSETASKYRQKATENAAHEQGVLGRQEPGQGTVQRRPQKFRDAEADVDLVSGEDNPLNRPARSFQVCFCDYISFDKSSYIN